MTVYKYTSKFIHHSVWAANAYMAEEDSRITVDFSPNRKEIGIAAFTVELDTTGVRDAGPWLEPDHGQQYLRLCHTPVSAFSAMHVTIRKAAWWALPLHE